MSPLGGLRPTSGLVSGVHGAQSGYASPSSIPAGDSSSLLDSAPGVTPSASETFPAGMPGALHANQGPIRETGNWRLLQRRRFCSGSLFCLSPGLWRRGRCERWFKSTSDRAVCALSASRSVSEHRRCHAGIPCPHVCRLSGYRAMVHKARELRLPA